MSFLIYLILTINFLWLGYLTYLVYIKNNSKNKAADLNQLDNNLKIGITRFNPFDDVGGDQSFILTILDKNNSGAIITSLHNRDVTRIYAKPIKNGFGENITLSKEEKSAIVKTIKN
ncbi:MAG: DUF4446 family protein [Candidatus Shapirobacteria bacterium]|nr:DUF4446 family protein [Candidatus Shapirobacteria bacterium]